MPKTNTPGGRNVIKAATAYRKAEREKHRTNRMKKFFRALSMLGWS